MKGLKGAHSCTRIARTHAHTHTLLFFGFFGFFGFFLFFGFFSPDRRRVFGHGSKQWQCQDERGHGG